MEQIQKNNEPTNLELLNAILGNSRSIDENTRDIKVVDKKIDALDQRVGVVENRVDTLENKLDVIDKRLVVVEQKVDVLDKKVDVLDKKVDENARSTDERFIEVLEAIQLSATQTDQRFEKVESDLEHVKNQMVTKAYLDEKLGDLRGDMTLLSRKQNVKIELLIESLGGKSIISREDVERILMMEPFPKLTI